MESSLKLYTMLIYAAILKYGISAFKLEILEYCDESVVRNRETYYIERLKPEYNILQEGGSSLGYKHTESTKEMLSELGKKRKHSDETKTSISKSVSGEYNHFFGKIHSKDSILKIIEGKSAHTVYVYNSKKILQIIYPSVRTMAKLINANSSTIVNAIKKGGLFRGEWYISDKPFNLSDTPLISD
ncbi:MAG: uncharacterized protein JWR59_2470 [Brevundimonas sp.]|nr:uncharacterized protein [Brevundimonas sp.]